MGYFEVFYNSPAQHPVLLWLWAAAAGAWLAGRRGLAPSLKRNLDGLIHL